jgi:glycine cleavage system transcriptional repressor
MTQQLVITAVGPDRKGLVGEFTGHVHKAGANLADSRMVNLRGRFALVVLIEGTEQALRDVRSSLDASASAVGLTLLFAEQQAVPAPAPGIHFRLKTYSMDQPGIVHKVTSFLQEQGINIEELETKLDSAPFMGTDVFTMEILMSVPKAVSVKALRRGVEELGDALNCDIDLDPA